MVSRNLLPLLGVQPLLGRNFTEEDERQDTVDPRLWAVAVALRRRPRRARPHDRSERHVLHRHRHRAGVVPVSDRRISVVGAAEQHRHQVAAAGRATARLRIFSAVARLEPGVTLQQAQADASALSARLAREFPATNEGVTSRARPRVRAARWRSQAGADDPARHRRTAAADRLRERREPDARADDRPRAGDGDPHRARRRPRPADPSADDRERRACRGRRPARAAAHDVGHRSAARGPRGARAARGRHPDRRDRAGVLDGRDAADRRALRPGSRAADRNGAVRIAQGKWTGHDGQQPRAPLAEHHRRRRNRAGGGGARGRRAPRSQLPHADGAGRRVRPANLVSFNVPVPSRCPTTPRARRPRRC